MTSIRRQPQIGDRRVDLVVNEFEAAVNKMIDEMNEDHDASSETVGDLGVLALIGPDLFSIRRIPATHHPKDAIATVKMGIPPGAHLFAAREGVRMAVLRLLSEHLYEGVLCRWVDHEHERVVFGVVPPATEPVPSFCVIEPIPTIYVGPAPG